MSEHLNMKNIISGSVESLEQMIEFIENLDDAIYQQSSKPLFDSTIGQHLRHILDLYMALIKPHHSGNIHYDVRRRGIALEHERAAGIAELRQVKQWLGDLALSRLEQKIMITTEVSIYTVQSSEICSTFGREICFASSHLTHHLALMAAIAKYLGQQVEAGLGVAPCTATFLRNEKIAERSCAQ